MQHFFEQCVWNYFKLVLNYVKFYSDFLFFSKPPLWIVMFKHDCHKSNVKVFPFNISFFSLSTNLCKRVKLNNYCTTLEATHINYIWNYLVWKFSWDGMVYHGECVVFAMDAWNYLVWKFSWGGISWRIYRLCYGCWEVSAAVAGTAWCNLAFSCEGSLFNGSVTHNFL